MARLARLVKPDPAFPWDPAHPAHAQMMEFEIRGRASGPFKINKKGDGQYRTLMEFATVDEARKATREQYDALVNSWEVVKARDNITERDLRGAEGRRMVQAAGPWGTYCVELPSANQPPAMGAAPRVAPTSTCR